MKKAIVYSFTISVLLAFLSCSKGAKPIDYGNDGCHYCKMTIVDKIHGAELVTDKGKVFKFDATECLINYINDNKELPVSTYLTNYYEAPTQLLPAGEAFYLISEKMPSPMGANLTAFKTKDSAEKVLAEIGGTLYTWETLTAHLSK